MNDKHPVDIYVVGHGMEIGDLSRKAEDALKKSKKIFYVAGAYGLEESLKKIAPNAQIQSLLPKYKEGQPRKKTYDDMASTVLNAALTNSPVSFLTDGHPLYFVLPTRQALKGAEMLGLNVKIIPGVSSLDTMLCDLRLDPGTQGLQVYEATDVLLRQRVLQPDVPCFLLQVGAIESVLFSTAPSKPERFEQIRDHLLQFYPEDHEIKIVLSSNFPLLDSKVISFTLGKMCEAYKDLNPGVTLYIPPVTSKRIQNNDLLEQLNRKEHLENLTFTH